MNYNMMNYHMTCLICNTQKKILMHMQQHVIDAHNYTQADLQMQSKRELEDGEGEGYIYTFTDGKDWLKVIKSGNYVGGI